MRFLRKDLLIVAALVAILTLMIIPLPQDLIDVLLGVNLSLAVILMIVAIYLKNPSDFSTFPTVILIATAFRLALSVGTTRLILSEADAGRIIETFGDFVVRGSVAVGLVIFLIITVVQFLVVTKGAERVAEVGARFALDALPGKQMSIDADIRAGTLTAEEGGAMRKRLDRDSQFFGAMDGAMKFVKGDAIAGLIIIVINLIGGLIVGTTLMGMSFSQSVSVFSLLTIGDGLVAQIPALMMSLCAGIIVTRVKTEENTDLGSDIVRELLSDVRVPAVSAAIILLMGFIPGFPFMVFALVSLCLLISWMVMRSVARAAATEAAEKEAADRADNVDGADAVAGTPGQARPASKTGDVVQANYSERFRVRLGSEFAASIDFDRFNSAIDDVFQKLHSARGVAFPRPEVLNDGMVPQGEIVVELDEVPIHNEEIPAGATLIEAGEELRDLLDCEEGELQRVDWIDVQGYWVPRKHRAALDGLRLTPIETEQALARLIFRVYEQNLGTLFSKSEFVSFMDKAREIDTDSVTLVEEALSPTGLMQTLRYLIEDGVPLRPTRLVLDALVHWTQSNPGAGPVLISECLRGSLKRQLCHLIAGPENLLGIAMIDPELETLARKSIADAKRTGNLASIEGLMFDAELIDPIVAAFRSLIRTERKGNQQVAVITSTDIRRRLRNFLASNNIHVPVLAAHEISADVMTCPVQLIKMPQNLPERVAEPA